MRRRKRRGDGLRAGRRVAAGASVKRAANSGSSLESIDIASEATRQVPERGWAWLPTDLSKNVDHYLYGTKKKEK